jgi:hypothetical protein
MNNTQVADTSATAEAWVVNILGRSYLPPLPPPDPAPLPDVEPLPPPAAPVPDVDPVPLVEPELPPPLFVPDMEPASFEPEPVPLVPPDEPFLSVQPKIPRLRLHASIAADKKYFWLCIVPPFIVLRPLRSRF